MPTAVMEPTAPRRSSVSQKLASFVPSAFKRSNSSSEQSGAPAGAESGTGTGAAAVQLTTSSKSSGKQVEMEGSSALERMPSPLEQGNALLASYKHAPALEHYAAALAAIPSPPCTTALRSDPFASTSTSPTTLSTSPPPTSSGFVPTPEETVELHLNHSLCRLKVGHYAIARQDSEKAIALLEEKEKGDVDGKGLGEKEKKMLKKAKWVQEMAVEGERWDELKDIPAR